MMWLLFAAELVLALSGVLAVVAWRHREWPFFALMSSCVIANMLNIAVLAS